MTQLLYGKYLAKKLRLEISKEVISWKSKGYRPPHLVVILIGNDESSINYVKHKIKDCENVGFQSSLLHFPITISENKLLKEIKNLNQDDLVDGFIIQLPLPNSINKEKIILSIDPNKDVDGFHPLNFGKLILNMPTFIPATPFGIIMLLKHYNIQTESKYVVVIGRSHIVGKPISLLMGRKGISGNSTVTVTHSYTPNIKRYTKQADIIITALGIPKFLKNDMIKKGSILIDVGITRIKDLSNINGYKFVGDIDFDSVYGKASYITPVPGGIGPMTRVMLLKNTFLAIKNRYLLY